MRGVRVQRPDHPGHTGKNRKVYVRLNYDGQRKTRTFQSAKVAQEYADKAWALLNRGKNDNDFRLALAGRRSTQAERPIDFSPFLRLDSLDEDTADVVKRALADPERPLPYYRVGRVVTIRSGELESWRRGEPMPPCMSGREFLASVDRKVMEVIQSRFLKEATAHRDKRRLVAKSQREAMFLALGRICAHCGATSNLSFDHITPWSHGGKTEHSNLRVLCRRCNSRRGNRVDPRLEFPGTVRAQ